MKRVYVFCLLGVIACLGYVAFVGSLAVAGEASHEVKLFGLVVLIMIRVLVGNARYATFRSLPR